MQKVVFHPPIPSPDESLQANFFDYKLLNQLNETRQNPASHAFVVGNALGVIDVPYKPGWIFIQRKQPDGTSILSECYVPTNEDGQTKILFVAGQLITPRKSSDTTPSYWIYDGIAPTPETRLVEVANSFGPVYGNGFPNEDGTTSTSDAGLPNVLVVDRIAPYSAGITSPISYKLTDSGLKDPATGQRLWKPQYTGFDFNTAAADTNAAAAPRAPQPPADNAALAAILNPCGVPGGLLPTAKLPLGNLPNRPVIKARVPVDPTKRQPPGGFRPVPVPPTRVLPPGQQPQQGPDLPPPPPYNRNPPGPPTGPGRPPPVPNPPPGGGGGGGTGGDGGGGGTGGTWVDDGANITGCFGLPWLLDRQGLISNDESSPGSSATMTRQYYNIRPQIDAAIKRLVGARYRPKNLIYVTLLFDGIHQTDYPIVSGDGGAEVATPYAQPRVYVTDTDVNPAVDGVTYWDAPPVQSKTYPMDPDGELTTKYQVFDFESVTLGSPLDPLACAPLHYGYVMTTLPVYSDNLLPLMADHPDYRVYLSCFMLKKEAPGVTPRALPYSHDFGDGRDGWTEGFDITTPIGGAMKGIFFNSPGPFNSTGWIKGWTITLTGWSNKADDLFNNTTLSNGEFGVTVTDGGGTPVASGSKNMYPPYDNHGGFYQDKPATFTWSFDNTGGVMLSPCNDFYFSVGGGNVINFQVLKKVEITPIFGPEPKPPTAPLPTGPTTGGGSGGAGSEGSPDPNAPRNGTGTTIPKGTPLGPPFAPDMGPGSDNQGASNIGPANAGSTSGGPSPAVGVAPDDVLSGAPVQPRTSGQQDGYSGLLPGKPVYLDASAPGGVTHTKPTGSGSIQQEIGTAANSTTIDINIRPATKLL